MPAEAKPLFRPDVIRPLVAAFSMPAENEAARQKLSQWAGLISSGRIDAFKEREILPDFLSDLFCGVLGYSGPATETTRFTFSREKYVEVEGEFADAVLGRFAAQRNEFVVALEGKGPKDPIDRPHAGRRLSAVEQAYRYAINLPCDWIIVTNIRQIRLYHKGSDQQTYELFETERLAKDETQLKRFIYLAGAERVVPDAGRCHFYDLLAESNRAGREITKAFYIQYADIRQDAFERLCAANPKENPKSVLASTQKLLDRVLFIAFCEDRGLLPRDIIRRAYEHSDPFNPRPLYENFRGLFRSIDTGNQKLKIPAYNGGLFAEDGLLDHLIIPDEVCAHFRDLGEYDYRAASTAAESDSVGSAGLVDVDLLGHVFEQSISDLEHLRNELDGLVEREGKEKHKNRRKKEGAFYTPAFITRYIVEQTLGSVLEARFERLRQRHELKEKDTARKAIKDPRVYDLTVLKKPQRDALIRFWEAWQSELETIRIVDPACGSGAFLIEAFDQMLIQYQNCNQRLEDLRGSRTLFDPDRAILQNNLYGVDLSGEAIEICRLSLWIKTAQSGKTLTSLDHTIRVGNSVVDDVAVHPLAFNWREAFPEVFESTGGGFDVVVGNPPYIRQEWLAPFKPHWQARFKSYHGVADIFTYFYELATRLLGDAGKMGFITSGSWVRGNFGAPLREVLSMEVAVDSMVDFGEYQPFEDAEMIRPSIFIACKQPPGGPMRLYKWLVSGKPPENLSDIIASSPTMRTDHLGADAWELETNEVLALRLKLTTNGKPLKDLVPGIFRGVLTGLNEVFVIDADTRRRLISEDSSSAELIKTFNQGTHLRSWCTENSAEYLIFSRRGIQIEKYPAVLNYLAEFRERLEPRPAGFTGKVWNGRKEGNYKWYEIQDSVDYWPSFESAKIVWPDICKLPRFSMDVNGRYLGNTAYFIPSDDYYLLGVLSSWATWFFISKTAQPLRLRGDRWQYRLFNQFMENVPIPAASPADRDRIAKLARSCSDFGSERYTLQTKVQQRLCRTFGEDGKGQTLGKLNQKAEAWWELPFGELGIALKTSFKLPANPFKNPRIADEWESYLAEKCAENNRLSSQLADAESEINELVYRLFDLSPSEIQLLKKEVEH